MNELYWIITLGNVSTFFSILTIVLAFIIFGSFIAWCNTKYDNDEDYLLSCKVLKTSIIIFIISIFGTIFIPTTTQLCVIYGVGGTIDYIQNNPKAKQLPDKVINACSTYLDKITEENENRTKRE